MLRKVAGWAVFVAMQGCQTIKPLRCLKLLQKAGEKLSLQVCPPLFPGIYWWYWVECLRVSRHAGEGIEGIIQHDSVLFLIFCSFSLENIRQKTTGEYMKVGPSNTMKLDFLSHQTWLKYFDLCSGKLWWQLQNYFILVFNFVAAVSHFPSAMYPAVKLEQLFFTFASKDERWKVNEWERLTYTGSGEGQ